MNERTADDVYSRVTRHIVTAIERGAGEYRMPWHGGVGSRLPVNVTSDQGYRGVNVLSLWAAAQEKGYESALWGTYGQWHALGAQVRKGEKATPVVFWTQVSQGEAAAGAGEAAEGAEREKTYVLGRGYWVFNASQVDGFSPRPVARVSAEERVRAADDFLFGVGADIRHGGGVACYWPRRDFIEMPPYENFKSAEAYYGTLAHELTHWTGGAGRLVRDLKQRFGTAAYAVEELVAELGAAFQLARLGLSAEPHPDHASYVASWLTLLKNDTRAVFTAAGRAQQAVDWLERRHALVQEGRQQPVNEHER
jgi:antirestriction protein ArdC